MSIFASTDHYIASLFANEDDVLLAAARSHSEEDIPEINVSPVQGRFLQLLASLCNAKRILEIGTLAGYSTTWMARALPADGKLITIEYDPHHAEVARKNLQRAGLEDRVEVRVGKAIDVLKQLENEGAGPFDMIFIDADKPPYTEYFQSALRMSRQGTLIIADNVIREGKILDDKSGDAAVQGVQRFNKMLAAESRVNATVLQMTGVKGHDGMALAVVK